MSFISSLIWLAAQLLKPWCWFRKLGRESCPSAEGRTWQKSEGRTRADHAIAFLVAKGLMVS